MLENIAPHDFPQYAVVCRLRDNHLSNCSQNGKYSLRLFTALPEASPLLYTPKIFNALKDAHELGSVPLQGATTLGHRTFRYALHEYSASLAG